MPRLLRWSVVGALAMLAGAPSAGARTLSFPAEADTYLDAGSPAARAARQRGIWVDGSPVRAGLLRFRVTGLAGLTVTGVRLRLYARNGSRDGSHVFGMSDGAWSERATWSRRPAFDGPHLAASGPVARRRVHAVDLGDRAVRGDGVVSFALITSSRDGVRWASREARRGRPRLIIDAVRPVSRVAGASIGSSDPTYAAPNHRLAQTRSGRILAVHGRHAQGVQLAWRDQGGRWRTSTRGRVADGSLLAGTGTGDWPASIAVGLDSVGREYAWIVWARHHPHAGSPLQVTRLDDLDAPGGPSVGRVVTLDAPTGGAYRADVGFDTSAPGASARVVWMRRAGAATYQLAAATLPDVHTPVALPVVPTVIDGGDRSSRAATVVDGAGGRVVGRSDAGTLTAYRFDPHLPTRIVVEGGGAAIAGGPSAALLADGSVLAAAVTADGAVLAQRFSRDGAPAPVELAAAGYTDPSVASDGASATLVAVRTRDGALVSRSYHPATSWDSVDRIELAPFAGGPRQPNALRDGRGHLRLLVGGEVGPTADQSGVLFLDRPF